MEYDEGLMYQAQERRMSCGISQINATISSISIEQHPLLAY